MAGNQITRARIAQLEGLGEEQVFSTYIMQGSIYEMLRAIFKPDKPKGYKCDPTPFYRWLDKGGERRREAYGKVKAIKAQLLRDGALDDAENADESNVRVMKLRTDVKLKLADVLDPPPNRGMNLNVNANVNVLGKAWFEGVMRAEERKPGRTVAATALEGDDDGSEPAPLRLRDGLDSGEAVES